MLLLKNRTCYICATVWKQERERSKVLKTENIKTISPLIRILEIISFASYNKTFLMCSQNPLLLYYSSTQQHSTPQFKAQLSNNTQARKWYIFLGQTKLFHRFALRKYVASRSLNRKRSLYVVLCEDQKSPPNKHLGSTHCSK